MVHPGLWLWTDAPLPAVYAAELFTVLLWVATVTAALWYRRWYRASLPVDLAVAFLAAAVFGNLIDRVLVGGARDWLASPIAVANFADVAAWGTLLLLAVELWRYPPSRQLLRVRTADLRKWPKPEGQVRTLVRPAKPHAAPTATERVPTPTGGCTAAPRRGGARSGSACRGRAPGPAHGPRCTVAQPALAAA